MIAWGIDTGITNNASAAARVERIGDTWHARVWIWQGSPGKPLLIERTVGPEARKLWLALGEGPVFIDHWYQHELKRGLGDDVPVRLQLGVELKDVYSPTRKLVHKDGNQRLRVAARGYAWTSGGWLEDERSGARVIAGICAVEAQSHEGKLVVSLPDAGNSHHDEAVAVMRALWGAGAGHDAAPQMAKAAGKSPYADQIRSATGYPIARY